MKKQALIALVVSVAALMFLPTIALAQEIEEIIVTAQKREQALQDVPGSIAALAETTIERMAIDEFKDYITAIPGISFSFAQGPNGARGRRTVGIRGVQRFGTGTASTVGYYLDETPIDISNPRIFDTNRIEVLRGPQGTLFGSGSVGGTIRLITNQPDPTQFSSRLDGSFSDTDSGGNNIHANAMFNIPFADNQAALRITGMYREEDGWIDKVNLAGDLIEEDVNATDVEGVRASLRFKPSERWTITPSVYWQRYELGSEMFITKEVSGFPKYSRTELASTASEETFTLSSITFSYEADKFEIISMTSFYDLENQSFEDFAGLANNAFLRNPEAGVPVVTDNIYQQETLIHETRIVSALGGSFEYVAGVFYEDGERPFSSIAISQGFNDIFGFALIPEDSRGEIIFDTRLTRDQTQFALFGEGTYAFNDSWALTLGLRWFQFESDTTDDFTGFFFPRIPTLPPGVSDEDGVNPKVALSYKATDDVLLYATAAKGFRPGNANFPLPSTCDQSLIDAGLTPPGAPNYESDELWSYEVGLKSSWLDNRLTANLAAFYMDWEDLQLVVSLGSCGGIAGFITNADSARSVGGEFELVTRPVEGLDLSLAVAYIDAELSEDSIVLNASKGDKLPHIPEWSARGSAQYGFPVFGNKEAFLRADIRYRDEMPLNLSGSSMTDSFTQIDFRVGVEGEIWGVALFGENVSNQDPNLSRGGRLGTLALGAHVISLRPRTIGINVTASF